MKLTYYGHSSFLIETGGKRILVDPFFNDDSDVKASDVTCDFVLLTHGHFDHVTGAAEVAKANDATIIANFEVMSHFKEKGCNARPLNVGGKIDVDFGRLYRVVAVHSSSFEDGSYAGISGGYVIKNDEGTLYIAGDTALTMDMQLIPARIGAVDVAILPIGDVLTMGYEDAAVAAEFVHCKTVIGCHFDTFPFIEIDKEAAHNHFKGAGIDLHLLAVRGEWSLG